MTNDNISILSLRMIGILEDNEKSILKDEGSFPQLMPCFFSFDLAFRSSHSIFKVSHGLFRFVQLALPVVLSFFLVGNSQRPRRARLADEARQHDDSHEVWDHLNELDGNVFS